MSQESIKTSTINKTVGKSILAALTQHELALVLDALLANLAPSSLEIALKRLPTDTQQTLQQILTPSSPTQVKVEQPTSLAKLEETWSALWGQWNDIVSEATDEEGKYIEQEADWEPPYFNDSAFLEDLEAIAKQMLPLLSTAYESEFSPNVDFAQILTEVAEEITASLPEWISSFNEGFYLESPLTNCLLRWEWLKAQDEKLDVFDFTQRIREWEEQAQHIELEQSAFFQFFTHLSETELEKIYKGLTAHRQELLWKNDLENIRSHWYEIYLFYLEKYAPENRLDTLRITIPQKWQNGLPVIEDLLAKEAYQEALSVLEESLASLLKSTRQNRSWSPESSLLITIPNMFYGGDYSENEQTLLRYYQQIATALSQSERVEALQIQLTAIKQKFNWSVMLEAFKKAKISEETRQNLFQSWRNYILQLTENKFGGWVERTTSNFWWLSWLLDTIATSQPVAEEFQKRTEQWLFALESEEKPSKHTFSALRLLTSDLAEIRGENWNQYPYFQSVVLVPTSLKTSDANSRQLFLKNLAPNHLWNQVMAYWEVHLEYWIPKPEMASKSDYTEPAKWLAALRELSPTSYQNLLAQWRIQHKQRRNLWKALEKIGLS